jgi:chromosomal replication initiation ATPase DnaA|tara:strand:- start:1999 stop:2238 length:240 start_codon:yes stop_codon:yes gene_type:complete
MTSAQNIINEVCQEYNVEKKFILGPTRPSHYTIPRQEAYRRIYETGQFTLPQIGRIFKRHHTTILHGIRRAKQQIIEQG